MMLRRVLQWWLYRRLLALSPKEGEFFRTGRRDDLDSDLVHVIEPVFHLSDDYGAAP